MLKIKKISLLAALTIGSLKIIAFVASFIALKKIPFGANIINQVGDESPQIYRVRCAAFKLMKNANLLKQRIAPVVNMNIVKQNSWYLVESLAFINKAEAESLKNEIVAKVKVHSCQIMFKPKKYETTLREKLLTTR